MDGTAAPTLSRGRLNVHLYIFIFLLPTRAIEVLAIYKGVIPLLGVAAARSLQLAGGEYGRYLIARVQQTCVCRLTTARPVFPTASSSLSR